MDFESKLKSVISTDNMMIDQDGFLDRFHQARKADQQAKTRFQSGIVAAVLILLTGYATVSTLDYIPYDPLLNNVVATMATDYDSEEVEAYIQDLALILIDEGDDIWDAAVFFDEIDYEPIKEWLGDEL